MDKSTGAVYLWIHDKGRDNLFYAGESFSDFIMAFKKEPAATAPVKPFGMNLSGGLDAALKAAAEKYKK